MPQAIFADHRDLLTASRQLKKFKANLYINSLCRNGTKWLGLRFYILLLWYRRKNYSAPEQWDEFIEMTTWMEVDRCLGFCSKIGVGHPSYSWTTTPMEE